MEPSGERLVRTARFHRRRLRARRLQDDLGEPALGLARRASASASTTSSTSAVAGASASSITSASIRPVVAACDVARCRAACHAREHTAGRAGDCRAADERADGDAAHVAALDRRADLGDGEDRPDREVRVARSEEDRVGGLERLERRPVRPRVLGALVLDRVDLVARGDARRTTPGTRTCPAGVITCVRRRSSVAGTIRVVEPDARRRARA